jgi:hypothetical protein
MLISGVSPPVIELALLVFALDGMAGLGPVLSQVDSDT